MLALSAHARIFVYDLPVDMRKSFEGLGTLVSSSFSENLLSGSYFVFLNRTKNAMKVLYWDGDGLALWYKRLEKGSFSSKAPYKQTVNRQEFFLLLEGITPKQINRRFSIS